jgi:polyisoprenyl-phosphate glycosyltransferase
MSRPLLSIVAPCFNEEQVLESFHAELVRVLDGLEHLDAEILLVDDGSSDGTLGVIEDLAWRDPRVRAVALAVNSGQPEALRVGVKAARGEAIVTPDCDLQHPPELIAEMVRRWESGDDVVSTRRTDVGELSLKKRAGTFLFYRLHNWLAETPLEPASPDFCLITRAACDAIDLDEPHFFLRGAVARTGLQRSFLEFDAPESAAGETKYSTRKVFALARDGFLSDPGAPSRLVVLAGGFLILSALLHFAFIGGGLLSGTTPLGGVSFWFATALFGVGVLTTILGTSFSPKRSKAHPLLVGTVFALIAVVSTWATIAGLPFFSESYIHLERGAQLHGLFASFGAELTRFRPLQWAFFQLLTSTGLDDPAIARTVTYGLHFANAVLVMLLVRAVGGSRNACLLTLLVFLAFPSARCSVWVDAISGPGRVTCMLAGLLCMQRYLDGGRALAALGSLVAIVVALGFHQSAMLLPFLYLLLAAHRRGEDRGTGWFSGLWRALRDPWVLAGLALAVGFAIYVGFIREGRHHGLKQAAAIAANGVRASLALAPEWLRVIGVDGLRGEHGLLGMIAGGAVVLGAVALFLWVLVKTAPLARVLLLGAAADLLPPVLSVGFVMRYSYFSAALAAVALGVIFHANLGRPDRQRRLVLGVLALVVFWSRDHYVDLRDSREAGAVVQALLVSTAKARFELGSDEPITLVNAPAYWGAEQDLPVFNWGLTPAIRRHGVSGPWITLRTFDTWTSSEQQRIEPAELEALLRDRDRALLVFDAATRRCDYYPPVPADH